jgi:hypothetical protein
MRSEFAAAGACLMLGFWSGIAAVGPASAVPVFSNDNGQQLDVGFQVQLWNVATFGATDADGHAVDDRNDTFIRRGRFGIKGRLRPDIKFQFTWAYDNIGKNSLTGSPGTPQSPEDREFYLWDGFATVALRPELASLTVGYFRPQVGRESITTAFNVNSFVKGLGNSYPRAHLVGRGSGRETGANIGGLAAIGGVTWNYNVGVFDPNHAKIIGADNGGTRWAPLWTWRLAANIGDPEMKEYDLAYQVNSFGKRKGITLAVDGAYQGATNEAWTWRTRPDSARVYAGGFEGNRVIGCDVMANYGPLNLNGEYHALHRTFSAEFVASVLDVRADAYTDEVWHVRAGYNFTLPGDRFLEPAVMYTRFDGDPDSAVNARGMECVLDVGLNYYLDKNRAKVLLHYAAQDGRPKSGYAPTGKQTRGDFLGMGLQLQF